MIDRNRTLDKLIRRQEERQREIATSLCTAPAKTFDEYVARVAQYVAIGELVDDLSHEMKGTEDED